MWTGFEDLPCATNTVTTKQAQLQLAVSAFVSEARLVFGAY
jgi:hypothetical protein